MTCFPSLPRFCVDVCRHRCPGDQSRLTERSHINVKIVSCLGRIGRYDLQILLSAQGDEGVSCAYTRMASTDNSPNTGHPLNLCNSTIQVRYTQKQVIYRRARGYQLFSTSH